MILLILNITQGTFFDTDIPVPVVMGQSYKLSVLGTSLVNAHCNIALPHEHLEDRVVNAFKCLTLKKQLAISMSENEFVLTDP